MLESTIVGVVRFSDVVAGGAAEDAQRCASALLDELATLAQSGGAEECFTRALLEKAGFLVALARSTADAGGWLEAFKKGCEEALEMRPLKGRPRFGGFAGEDIVDPTGSRCW